MAKAVIIILLMFIEMPLIYTKGILFVSLGIALLTNIKNETNETI